MRSNTTLVNAKMTMDAAELARWTRFAAKGGIGKCTATHDCVAESAEDLMFLKVSMVILCVGYAERDLQEDEITVLMQLADHEGLYLVSTKPGLLTGS